MSLTNFTTYLRSQLFARLPLPTEPFTGQTIIVTGANTGLGLEAARHFLRLDAARVILAVRSLSKGEVAVKDLTSSFSTSGVNANRGGSKQIGVVEAWKLDLASHASIKAFARRAEAELDRVDVLVANAGVFMHRFEVAEEAGGDEMTVAVNVVGHMLLAMLLLPKMRETAVAAGEGGKAVVVFTGSFTHWITTFPERKEADILGSLNDPKKARMDERYYISKLIQLLLVREFAEQLTRSTKPGKIVTSVVNPGFVKTQIMRHSGPLFQVYLKLLQKALARTPEVGSRTLVHAAYGADETHGKYLDDCKLASPSAMSAFVLSGESVGTQKQLWRELSKKLEEIQPVIMGKL